MEALFIYLLKSAILLSVIAIIYHLFLRKSTFFILNRIYLLLGLFASFALPLIQYSYDVTVINIPITQEQLFTPDRLTESGNSFNNIPTILFTIYITGIALYLLRILQAYKKVNRLMKKGNTERGNGYKIITHKDIESPFSVLNNIFINTGNLSDTEREAVLRHEITHIKQRHWIDLLCSECMLLLQWFNPMVRLYISLQKENHEFLADKAVVRSGISPALYKAVLLNLQFNGPVFPFANSFNYSNKSKRLIMVTKEKSPSWKRMLILVLIPVFTIHIWATAEPNYITELQSIEQVSPEQISMDAEDTAIPKSVEPQDKEPIPFMAVEVKPKFQDDEASSAFRQWVWGELVYPKSALEKKIQGRVTVEFTIDETGNVKDIKVMRGVDPALDAEAVRVISSSPKWTPGMDKGKIVAVSYIFPVVFALR